MPDSKTAPGCRYGALTISTTSSAEGCARRLGANIAINLVRPTPSGDLPMRRIFEDQQGNQVGQLDLWKIRIRRAQAALVPRDDESRPSAGLIALSFI